MTTAEKDCGILMSGQLKYYGTCSFCGVCLWSGLISKVDYISRSQSVIVVFPFFPLCCQQTYLSTKQILCKFG